MPDRLDRLKWAAMAATSSGHEFFPISANYVPGPAAPPHPFDDRNIITSLPSKVQQLFDDGHYAEATFEAMKYLEKYVQQQSGLSDSGRKLMMDAFGGSSPPIALNPLSTNSELDEQEGFKFLFAGAMVGIRNPRGHDSVVDSPQECLDHLALVSLLLRKLSAAGH